MLRLIIRIALIHVIKTLVGSLKVSVLVLLTLFGSAVKARDLGEFGATYAILEMDALEWIEQRLNQLKDNHEIERLEAEMKEKVVTSIKNRAMKKSCV